MENSNDKRDLSDLRNPKNIFEKYRNRYKWSFFNRERRAITSYGLIVFTTDTHGVIRYLLMKRRDSISYIEFLKNHIKENEMVKYISLMTLQEKERCIKAFESGSMRDIWDDLWINHSCKTYKEEYEQCNSAFMSNMEKFIDVFRDSEIGLLENDYGFPKGRRFRNEMQVDCALREFKEETNMDTSVLRVFKTKTYDETYIGTDNKLYKTVFYIAYCTSPLEIRIRSSESKIRKTFISDETDELSWDTLEIAINKLNKRKSDILSRVQAYILECRQQKNRKYFTR